MSKNQKIKKWDLQKIEKWDRWLLHIHNQVSFLVQSRSIYSEIRQIVGSNPEINTSNRFYEWITTNYVDAILMGIRRQIDGSRDTISLKNLLNEMKNNCCLLSRGQHLTRYNEGVRDVSGNSTFDALVGKTIDVYPVEKIEQDLQQIEQIEILHKNYIDKRLAHFDKKEEIKALGTFQDIDNAVSRFEGMVKRYYLVFKAEDISSLLSIPDDAWKEIFKQPWIPDANNDVREDR